VTGDLPTGAPPDAPAGPATPTVVSLHSVSKVYLPPPRMRARRFFSRLGGLHVEDGFAPDAFAGQIEDDEDEMEEDTPVDDGDSAYAQKLGDRVVDGVTLHAEAGSTIALVGPDGAGKTVLLKLIAGIVAPSAGRVVVRGTVVPALNVMSLVLPVRGHTVRAALPQLGAMVGLPPGAVRDRFGEIADLMGSPALLKSSTSLMESRRKRELVLAMALTLDPDILVLDMPIASDDFGDRCVERLMDLRSSGTLVIAEMRDLRKTRIVPDRIVSMDEGKVIPDDPGVSATPSPPDPV